MPTNSTKSNTPVDESEMETAEMLDFTADAVDFSSVSTSFPVKEPGLYPGIVTDAEVRPGQSGYKYVNATIDLDGGGKCWATLSWSPNALWRTKKSLVALGVDLNQPLSPEAVERLIMNCRCVVQLAIDNFEDDDGEPAQRNSVKNLFPADYDVSAANARRSASNW